MKDEDAISLSVCAGVTGFALAYLSTAFLVLPRLAYFPARHALRVVVTVPPEAIGWVGLLFWGIVAGVDAAVVTLAAARVSRRSPSATFHAMCTGWTLLALALTVAFFALSARG